MRRSQTVTDGRDTRVVARCAYDCPRRVEGREVVPGSSERCDPSIIFQDDDLNRGTKLVDYKIEGEGQVHGTGYSYVVALTLGGKDKPQEGLLLGGHRTETRRYERGPISSVVPSGHHSHYIIPRCHP